MPTLTMAPTLGDLLKYELNASYCRETVIPVNKRPRLAVKIVTSN